MNSIIRLIFNEKVVKKWNSWVREQCTLYTVHKKKVKNFNSKKKKKLKCKRASGKRKTRFPNAHYLPYLPQYDFSKPTNKSINVSSSKFSVYFIRKNLLFLFCTITFIKHSHQFIYFTRFFNKIFILLNFFYYFSQVPLPTYMRSLFLSLLIFPEPNTSLSLSLSLSFLPSLILSQKLPT